LADFRVKSSLTGYPKPSARDTFKEKK
jgi:hypothetical protein